MPREREIASVKPKTRLLRRLPHVARLAFPRARVAAHARPQAPTLADFIRHFLGNDWSERAVHRLESGRHHDEIRR